MSLIIGSDHLEDHAPHRRTLSRTTDFDQLGHHDLSLIGGLSRTTDFDQLGLHDLPLVGGLVAYNRLRPAKSS